MAGLSLPGLLDGSFKQRGVHVAHLLHFLHLRMDEHAQWEIRQYAKAIGEEIVRPLFPIVWEAFLDYQVGATHLTRLDREVIGRLAAAGRLPADEADFLQAQDPEWAALSRCRERDECRDKLVRLGLLRPAPGER